MPSLLKSLLFAIVCSSSPNYNKLVVNASSLPSNALNRWALVRGGETSTAALSSTPATKSSPTITMVSVQSTAPKKKRKKKATTSSSAPSSPPPKTIQTPKVAPSKQSIIPVPPPAEDDQSESQNIDDSSSIIESAKSIHDKMPSIFSSDESIYDKYAACLAATEGLRRIRDSKVENKKFRTAVNVDAEKSGWKSLLKQDGQGKAGEGGVVREGSNSDMDGDASSLSSVEQQKEEYKRACAEYVLNSSKVIKALGLSVTQFNQLGREIKKNRILKEKVMEQAYLYRMACTIHMDKIPLIEDPNSKKLLQSHKRRRVAMFVKSITEIEELRTEQMDRLKRALNIDKFPANMNLCDPNVLPLLDPKVRAVIQAFPIQAEVIVKKYGLNSDEFNQMLEETKGNPIFRWRVQRFKNQSQEEDDGKSKNNSGVMGEL